MLAVEAAFLELNIVDESFRRAIFQAILAV